MPIKNDMKNDIYHFVEEPSSLFSQKIYWLNNLSGELPETNLLPDYARPVQYIGKNQFITFEFSDDLAEAIIKFTQGSHFSIYLVLLSALSILLHKYTGSSDVIVGSPTYKQENDVGLDNKIVPLRFSVSDRLTFKDLLLQVKDTTISAYSHQNYPFEQLVQLLKLPQLKNRCPIFDIVVLLENIHEQKDISVLNNDITISFVVNKNSVTGKINYNQSIFQEETIYLMIRYYINLLEDVFKNISLKISDIDFLKEADKQQLLKVFNDNAKNYPITRTIHSLFEEQVLQTPNKIAVVCGETQLTYQELNEKANKLARFLRSLGVKKGEFLGILKDRDINFLIAILAIFKAGGAYVPIDNNYPPDRIKYMLSNSEVRILLTDSVCLNSLINLIEYCPHLESLISLDVNSNNKQNIKSLEINIYEPVDFNKFLKENLEEINQGIDPAYMLYTSGSTGLPKGAIVRHDGAINHIYAQFDELELTENFCFLQSAPSSTDISVWQFLAPLLIGGKTVIVDLETASIPEKLFNVLKEKEITVVELVPAVFSGLLDYVSQISADRRSLSALKWMMVVGEPVSVKRVNQWLNIYPSIRIANAYGPTEAADDITQFIVEKPFPDNQRTVPIGKPLANLNLYILDSQMQLVPIGVPGEICVSGIGVGDGYWKNEEKTRSCFVPNPFPNTRRNLPESNRDLIYKTGDLGRWLPDGNIEFLGRIDNQVKIRGFRIELGEIEARLGQHPDVRENVVVVREDSFGDKCLVAYVVPIEDLILHKDSATSNELVSQLRNFLQEKLPQYMMPSAFVLLESLPIAPSGKVDRRSLPAPDWKLQSKGIFVAPSTPIEEILAGIWAEVLKLEKISIHDNFFELGGHSLLATRVISQMRQAFEIELPLRRLFEEPTVAGFAKDIERAIQAGLGLDAPPIERISRVGELTLSFAQQRLWFLSQLEPNNPFYNLSVAVRLQGQLNQSALEQTFNEILRRHEALRTNFQTVEGQAVVVIAPVTPLPLLLLDLSELPPAQREAEVKQLVSAEAQHPFDLNADLLLRLKLLRLGEQEHILLLTVHHIASDGWSIGVMVREMATLYQAFCEEQPSLRLASLTPLPELPIQYADFAAWQRQWLRGEVLASQMAYWRKQLEDAPAVLELPTDKPRPAVQTFRGATYSFELSKELSVALNQLSQQAGSTLFMTLLAAFKILLGRYTGSEDIVVGTPIANRNRAEIEGLIGFFVNTLVLRTDLSGNPSFRELLTRVREVALGAYAHQDLPFEQLVEELHPQRALSHTPLFQVMFVLQNAPMSEMELSGLTLSFIESHSGTAQFDLTLYVEETAEGLLGTFEYNTDLFEAVTIDRIAGHFQTLLAGIITNPDRQLQELPLLSKAERHQLLVEWNDTESEYPSDKCIHQLFEEQVERTPDAIALVLENQQLTYRQLNQRANQLAHYLRSLEVGSGVLVGICVEPSLDLVVSLLGVLKANGVYVPLDPKYPQERLAFMLENSNVHILLTQESLTEKISPQHTHIVCLDRDRDAIGRESVENLDCQVTLDDLAYAIYTSGSTGKPKAVLGKLRGIVNRLHWMWETLPFGADEICCQKTSINFVDHVAEIFSPLLKGIPLAIVPDNIRGDIPRLMSLLSDRKITRIVVVPSLLKAMLDNAPQQLTQLRYLKYVFCSGEALPLALAEAFHQKLSSARLFNLYGSSEVAADVTCFEVNFWEIRQRILQYFKPEVVRGATENQVLGVHQKPFTKPGVSLEMLATKFQRSELPSYPLTVDDYYDKLSHEVLPYAIDTGSPTFIGHMTSALPDFMHDLSKMISQLNQNLVKIETSKSLIFLEREAIAILHRLVYNFSGEFYEENIQQKNRNLGIITTGGTTANISALLCARNSGLLSQENSGELSTESLYKVLSKKGYDDIVIIGSRLIHYSLNKAASMLGLGTDNIVFIDSNDDGKLDLNLLKEKIRECKRNKLYILALVAIAGTTETGEIDPLFELGDIAREFGIHFHVDAAWGGATIFSEKHKGKLKGINKADSITICGHKQLYLPQGISVCLFKDPQILNFVETTARYQAQRDTFDVGRFTIEGSRSALSLCLHGALHIIGKRGYEILIDNGIEKAQYFSRLIELLEPFDLVMEPALNIVNYRYIPKDLRAKAQQKSLSDDDIQRLNQINTQIQREQFEQGMTFVSKTTLMDAAYGKDKEIVVFRAVLSNPNTTATDLQSVLEDQLRIANQIEARSKEIDGLKNLSVQRSGSIDTEDAVVYKEAIHLQLADDPKADLGEALEDYLKKHTIPIGKPISNTQIYILDKYGNLLPPGVTGEIYVGGDGLAQGYLNLPELTGEKFILNPFTKDNGKSKKAERLYRTGDLARYGRDGNIEFLGRIDHQVKIRGFRIELGEIEAVLNTHPQIQQAVVIATDDTAGNKRLVTYIVTRDESFSTKQLREFLFSKLPEYMVPSAFVTLDTLPLTPNGKVDRKALPAPDGEISREHEYIAPHTASEEIIANIFASVIGVQNVGIHDNFFDLGGHSLLATQVISRLREAFLMELPLRRLFEKPTVAGISEQVENMRLTTQKQQSFTTAAFGVREEGIL